MTRNINPTAHDTGAPSTKLNASRQRLADLDTL